MSKEFELLVAAAIAEDVKCADVDKFEELLRCDINWPVVVKLARFHGVTPQLSRKLRSTSPQHPVLDELKPNLISSAQFNLFLANEFIRIQNAFTNACVPILTFKGPSLALVAYGDLGLRNFNDLDILVHLDSIHAAIVLLSELGYSSYDGLDSEQQLFQLQSKGEVLFRHPNRACVDLHCNLSQGGFPFPVSFEDLWSKRQLVESSAGGLYTFSPLDLCIYSSIHGSKHEWSELRWILDFVRLASKVGIKDIENRAKQIGEHRIVDFAFVVSETVLGFRFSERIGAPVRSSFCQLSKTIRANADPGVVRTTTLGNLRFHLIVRGEPVSTIRYAAECFFTPHLTDWNWIKMPRKWWWLYAILRPLRLFLKFFGRNK